MSNIRSILIFLTVGMASGSPAVAGLFGPEPIVGHCTGDKSVFDSLISQNNYTLQQTSQARDGRLVMYFKAEDFMIAVADEERSLWCIQFTSENPNEFVEFLVGRYDPTTRDDEGTE